MDWSSLSRLVPEAVVLAIVGYFAMKGVDVFKNIVDKIDSEHHDALIKLSKSIDKNTTSNTELTKLVKIVGKNSEQHLKFMENLNGKLAKATIQTVKEQRVEHQDVHKTIVRGNDKK